MKTNIFLLILAVFIVSLIITLNIFFQQNYQSEMAEQFNRQQLLIAKSVAKSIEGYVEHIEEETIAFSSLLADRGFEGRNMEEFVNTAFAELKEEIVINLKILDNQGKLRYSSSGESLTDKDLEFDRAAHDLKIGKVKFFDRIADQKKTCSGRSGGSCCRAKRHAYCGCPAEYHQ